MEKTSKKELIVRGGLILAVLLTLVILAAVNWDYLVYSFSRNFANESASTLLPSGLANTFLVTIAAFLMGLILGTLVCIINQSKSQNVFVLIGKQIAKFYVLLFRGTPVVVQLLVIYFVIFASYKGEPIYVAMLCFGLNSGAYVSEYIRGGIGAVPKGQLEAGLSLGLSYRKTMSKIVLPQAYKNCFPSLCNEIVSLIKETSVVGFIGAIDLTKAFQKLATITYDYMTVYLVMGAVYFIIVMILTYLLSLLERKVFKNA
ncbi:MAG: amino acid ABC transporter permease [Bacilli bacterium]|jgi:polar amino acid transport system substrate-binding protein|nr:amino acid ABC transporter permease [Bacilli bacterium]MCH4210468.1 amino acid ABC transporter permease [Bacilli bacterium]MCH4228357.1 amino acid ABC transporter permease [Bacilli bacterium]MCH4277641.1 amino acid ABC transporter permease [Bacilli bacterium]MCI2054827.1 amino acid ABC transporter permease [Bacilli bacterium]